MASLWPLTFFSGERPRAPWALLFLLFGNGLPIAYGKLLWLAFAECFSSPENKSGQGELLWWPIVRCPSFERASTISLNNFSSDTTNWILTKLSQEWSLDSPLPTIPVDYTSRSLGQKIGFQNAIVKNLLLWNYKTQSFHIWYIALSRGPLLKLFKLCPWG